MIAKEKVINISNIEGITIKCKHCKNKQEYTLRDPNKIPNRPKTQCSNPECDKWIYIDRDVLVKKFGQEKLTNDDQKTDQKKEQKKPLKSKTKSKKPKIPKNNMKSDMTNTVDQRPKHIDQMTKNQNLSEFIRSISGELVIALNYAINSIKNKPEVVAKKKDATRFNYFKNWSQYREFFRKLDNEIKEKMGISKKGLVLEDIVNGKIEYNNLNDREIL